MSDFFYEFPFNPDDEKSKGEAFIKRQLAIHRCRSLSLDGLDENLSVRRNTNNEFSFLLRFKNEDSYNFFLFMVAK